jgi:CRISPR-associated protein Cas5d
MLKRYPVNFEIAGPAAIFTRPDSGAGFVSYPLPTYSAVRGMFDCVAFWKSAYIRPERVEVCNPIQFQRYATNYGGPLRKGNQIAGGSSYQLFATILIDVCYKVRGAVVESSASPGSNNHLHALQELFERRLKQGRFYRTPCLGWSEFTPTYFGPLRETTHAREDVEVLVPSMLRRVFDRDSAGQYGPSFDRDVRVEKGVLSFAQ